MDKLLKLPLKWGEKKVPQRRPPTLFRMSKSFWFRESFQDFFSEPLSVPE